MFNPAYFVNLSAKVGLDKISMSEHTFPEEGAKKTERVVMYTPRYSAPVSPTFSGHTVIYQDKGTIAICATCGVLKREEFIDRTFRFIHPAIEK